MSMLTEGMERWKKELEQWLHEGMGFLHQIPPTQLYIACVILLLTTGLLLLRNSAFIEFHKGPLWFSSQGAFFMPERLSILRDGSSHQGTVTSMEPNEGTFVLHSESNKKGKTKPIHLVDVPGHSRLRTKLEEFLPLAAATVFVVDALEFLPNCRPASDNGYLYDILTKSAVVKKKIPVLICCNKTDKLTAHTKEFIWKQMEKEIDKLRTSRSAVSEADVANDFALGIPGEAFQFSHCHNKVTVAESSGLTGEIAQVEQFISEHVNP